MGLDCTEIAVQSLSGDTLHLSVSSDVSISELKEQISVQLPIPAQYQMLLVGPATAADTDKLAQFEHDDAATLHMTVLVSRDLVTSDVKVLSDGAASAESQIQMLASLSRLGTKCGEDVIREIAKLVESSDADVCTAAWRALEQVARKGDADAIAAASHLLESSKYETRCAAKELLGLIADKGDEHVLNEMISRLGHTDPDVALVALELLGRFAHRGCRTAISAVCELLEDDELRWAAVEALGKVVQMGDRYALNIVRKYATSHDRNVRWAATEAMGRHIYDSA